MIYILEIFRGLAALWVFLFHSPHLFQDSSVIIYELSKYGHLGVPMFFVISGFVITYSAESSLSKGKPAYEFLRNRFLRIYPTFWISIIAILFIPYIIEAISAVKTGNIVLPPNKIAAYAFTEWINFVLLSKVFFSIDGDLQGQFRFINAVYWTIAIEFQFYLVVYVALMFKSKYKLMIGLVTLISILNLIFTLNINSGLFIHFWPEFSVGIALSYLFKKGYTIDKTSFVTLILVSMSLFTSVFLFNPFFLGSGSLTFAILFALFLWCFYPLEFLLVKIANKKGSVSYKVLNVFFILGAMSYSVYLLHGKLYQLSEMFVRQILESNNFFYGILTVSMTLIMCYPFYLLVERRFLSKNYTSLHQPVK